MTKSLHLGAGLDLPLSFATALAEFGILPETITIRGVGRGRFEITDREVVTHIERLCARTAQDSECWIWTGSVRNGYGSLSIHNSQVYAHHFSFMASGRALAGGEEICHSCDIRRCWRPCHLSAGTRLVNVQDMYRKGRNKPMPYVPGEKHGRAKLSNVERAQICDAYAQGGVSQRELARMHEVGQHTIWRVIRHQTFRKTAP